jgi:acyl dehydratase
VRPGDQLTVRLTTIDKRVSRTKPDRGIVRTMIEGVNQHGEIVVGYRAMNIFSLRHPAKA